MAVIAGKDQIDAAAAQSGKVAVQNGLPKGMNRLQPAGIDKYVAPIPSAGFEGVDQFMGRRSIEIAVERQMDAVFALKLDNFEIHGHGKPSFPPPGSGIIRFSEAIHRAGGRCAHRKGW